MARKIAVTSLYAFTPEPLQYLQVSGREFGDQEQAHTWQKYCLSQ